MKEPGELPPLVNEVDKDTVPGLPCSFPEFPHATPGLSPPPVASAHLSETGTFSSVHREGASYLLGSDYRTQTFGDLTPALETLRCRIHIYPPVLCIYTSSGISTVPVPHCRLTPPSCHGS